MPIEVDKVVGAQIPGAVAEGEEATRAARRIPLAEAEEPSST